MVTDNSRPQGICPSCGDVVRHNEDAVWTCRYNLNPANGYYIRTPFSEYELECMRGPGDGSSLCLDDLYGYYGACEEEHRPEHMPLHMVCYEKGDY